MSEVLHLNEACMVPRKNPFHSLIARFRKSKLGAVLSLISALAVTGCASELKFFKKGDCESYMARTAGDSKTHGYKEVIVYPLKSKDPDKKGYRCAVMPKCQGLDKKKELPEPKDCVNWSQPCERE